MLRTERGVLRPLWSLVHEAFLRAVAAWLRRGLDVGVYVGGTFGRGEPVYGISDIDLIVVAAAEPKEPGGARMRVHERWRRLCRAFPPAPLVVSDFYAYEDAELREAVSSTCFTYGLDGPGPHVPRALYFGSQMPADEACLLFRPGLWATQEWRLVGGRDLRAAVDGGDAQRRRLVAWLELQFWWRLAFAACVQPEAPHVPYLCVKLAAEPARVWLWLAHGEQVFSRLEVLERAFELIPEEEPALRRALELHCRLPRSPAAPIAEVLPCFVRLSALVARRIVADAETAGATEVRLLGAGRGGKLLPLADWRALVRPIPPGDEAFELVDGDPADPETLAAAAVAGRAGAYPALRADGLLVFPAADDSRAELRAVQCAASDPVSFALAEGRTAAGFPDVAGWSARDTARRAVAEHRAWLEENTPWLQSISVLDEAGAEGLAMLLSAARAAIFLEGVEAGEPELAVTLSAAAERLAARGPHARGVAEEAQAAYHAARGEGSRRQETTLAALLGLVRGLPAYSPPEAR